MQKSTTVENEQRFYDSEALDRSYYYIYFIWQ